MHKDTRVVGHMARKIAAVLSVFAKGWSVSCMVTSTRRHLYDLPQGGMEIPCLLFKFCGDIDILQKVKNFYRERMMRIPQVPLQMEKCH